MKIYLDNSALNRPFDDQSLLKIRLETIAIIFILELVDKRKIKLVNSSVIEYENFQNPFFERRIWISAYLSKASFYQKLNLKIKERAKEIERLKIPPIDSLHLASAEVVPVDYFITSDYDILRKYKGELKVLDPIKFIQILKLK